MIKLKSWQTILNNQKIIIALTGVGPKMAFETTSKYIDFFHPQTVISTGWTGALTKELKIGDIFIANELAFEDKIYKLNSCFIEEILRPFGPQDDRPKDLIE